jgi:hypothetical protein
VDEIAVKVEEPEPSSNADPFVASDRRLAFLDGASGLAHLYIGFAELERTAVGQ